MHIQTLKFYKELFIKKENKEEIVLEKPDPILNEPERNAQSNEQAREPSPSTLKRDEPKLGRNEVVKISNGVDTKEIKYKKAKPLIETGEWKII